MAIIEKVIIPALLSLLTGIIIGLTVGLFAYWRAWEAPGLTGALIGCCAMALCWLALLRRFGSDGEIVAPALHFEDPQPDQVRVSVISDNGGSGDYLDMPISHERMIDLAVLLAEGADFSHAALAGRHRLLSRSQYEAVRDYLLRRDYLDWVNADCHSQGLVMRSKGRALFRAYASLAASSLPQLIDE